MNFKNTLASHFKIEKALTFIIESDIMDMVITDILFNMNDKEFVPTCEWTLSIFKLFEDINNDQVELGREQDLNHKAYKVEINSLQLFCLVMSFVSCRASLQMAICLMDVMKRVLYMGCFNGCIVKCTALLIRVICDVSL